MKKILFIIILSIITHNVYAKWNNRISDSLSIETLRLIKSTTKTKEDDCYDWCKHLLPSPSKDLQSSEYRACWRRCMGRLD